MNATHYRVTIKIGATGGVRTYTYTDATDAADARRNGLAAVTVDFGFMNMGAEVESVKVWNFETKAWDLVEEVPPVKDVADMTADEKYDELCRMWLGCNNGTLPYFGFNGGGPASPEAKRFLRSLLTEHAGRREAELIRGSLNESRANGEAITRTDVLPAIRILKAL